MFVADLFARMKYKEVSFNDPLGIHTYFTCHLVKQSQVDQAVEKLKFCRAVVPLRHPCVVWESWKRKKMDFQPFQDAWLNLIKQIDPFNPCYLPIDSEKRDYYLWNLNHKLGLDIKTDWPVINSRSHTSHLIYQDLEEDQSIVTFIQDISCFINRFYG